MKVLYFASALLQTLFIIGLAQNTPVNEPSIVNATKLDIPIPSSPATSSDTVVSNNANILNQPVTVLRRTQLPENIIVKIYRFITDALDAFINSQKVREVLKNVGTCMVNGVLDIVSYYVPAPLIPLLASAAGMIIPFEPVVMLKQKMPVSSYRRAFSSAANSFFGTFEKYKQQLNDEEPDPYMTRRFNRRMINSNSAEKKFKKDLF